MFETDLHVHSIKSTCGFHTLLEIVSAIGKRGLRGFALTDHGPVHETPRPHFSVMLRRMPGVIDGIRVFKGIEATILDDGGGIDIPRHEGFDYEIVLAGLHHYGLFERSQGVKGNTRAVVEVMRRLPEVKIITHPFYRDFPLDMDAVTDAACETGTALEVNNTYLGMDKADEDALMEMLERVKEKGTLVSVDSDGHLFHEMGRFDLALGFMERLGMENFTVVNRTLESTLEFLGLEE